MDFGLSQDQRELVASTERFARAAVAAAPSRSDRDPDSLPRKTWDACAQFGLCGLTAPPEYEGAGHTLLDIVLILETLGRCGLDNGLLLSLNAHLWTAQTLTTFGSADQKSRVLSRLARGEWIGALAMTEPDSGSDAFALLTRAERVGDEWVLDGRKCFVTNGPVANALVVFARSPGSSGQAGITAFLVERDTPGMVQTPAEKKLGLHGSPLGDVVFENCRIPHHAALGEPGTGHMIFNAAMEFERTCILAGQTGAMERLLVQTARHASRRRTFGRPIAEHPPVASRLADMEVRLEAARMLIYKAAWAKDQGGHTLREAAIAKLYASEAAVASALDAFRIFGGMGYLQELSIERELLDALGGLIYSGTSDLQRLLIAAMRGVSDR